MTMHEMMNGNGVNETAGRQPETVLTLFETAEELQTKVLLRRMEEALRRRRPPARQRHRLRRLRL